MVERKALIHPTDGIIGLLWLAGKNPEPYPFNLAFSSLLTSPGLAWPCVAFMT